ncbi:hypothetical protein OPV22_021073 [Ensete ventricosum]|uniref:Uncharacterized protein n=1 Tax=Ensete ventricosum TaxID=4639 RepID=A0AAV8PCL7_ENSVE|nr:hypothetical protein OPV22_021073 [Ensete ventricosum]
MSMAKGSKLLQYINYRGRVTIQTESHERRPRRLRGVPQSSPCKGRRRCGGARSLAKSGRTASTLGLVLFLGEEVVSMTVEGSPPPDESRAKALAAAALGDPGISTAPLVQAQPGLSGPVRGVGGPAPGMMQPQISRPPVPLLSAPPISYPSSVRCQSSCGCSTAIPGAATDAEGPSPAMRPGMPVPLPPRVGMPPPLGGPVPVFAPPRPGMPPPPPPPNQH